MAGKKYFSYTKRIASPGPRQRAADVRVRPAAGDGPRAARHLPRVRRGQCRLPGRGGPRLAGTGQRGHVQWAAGQPVSLETSL